MPDTSTVPFNAPGSAGAKIISGKPILGYLSSFPPIRVNPLTVSTLGR